ncbi:AMP-binding protein [Streptomyces rectiviolaceus]|uniref:AMP-dependent synthetase/ligase domain-containing protein n=1 Tax=Streptomyces rectiviolaceus TaxID=332591 RepID=A0ABP6MC09_9ACTN
MVTAQQLHESVEGLTIPRLLRRNAQEFAERPALTSGIGPEATTLTWSRLRSEVAAFTHGLASLGLREGDRMLIVMSKRPEHWIADLAAIHLGVLACSLYDTLSSELPKLRTVVTLGTDGSSRDRGLRKPANSPRS